MDRWCVPPQGEKDEVFGNGKNNFDPAAEGYKSWLGMKMIDDPGNSTPSPPGCVSSDFSCVGEFDPGPASKGVEGLLLPTLTTLFIKCCFQLKSPLPAPRPATDSPLSVATLSVSEEKELRPSLPEFEIKQVINFSVWPTVGTLSFFFTTK